MNFLDMSIVILVVFSTLLMSIPMLYEPIIGLIQLFKDLWTDKKEENPWVILWLYATTISSILLILFVIIKMITVITNGIFK